MTKKVQPKVAQTIVKELKPSLVFEACVLPTHLASS